MCVCVSVCKYAPVRVCKSTVYMYVGGTCIYILMPFARSDCLLAYLSVVVDDGVGQDIVASRAREKE